MSPTDPIRAVLAGFFALASVGCYQGMTTASEGDGDTGTSGADDGVGDDDGPSTDEDVGRVALHRLTRLEYESTLADLFGMSFEGADFIRGGTGAGFSNQTDLLRDISEDLAEGYIEHARDVAAEVFADPAARDRVSTCTPANAADTECAAGIIASFGQRAWRRPLDAEEVSRFEGHYRDALDVGLSHDEAIEHLVRMFLGSPNFVFHVEIDADPNDTTPHRLDGFGLANRLSYMLWNSMPDNELFAVAASGAVVEDDELVAQVDRMLDDPRADRFRRSFLEAWLRLPLLDAQASIIDVETYPSWTSALGQDMRAELEAYIQEFFDAGLPWSEFLTTDLNFVTPLLAEHYGIELPAGSEDFVRIESHPDQRTGYLGLAGFLTYTSRSDRTAPSLRGKIVLESLQCTALVVPADIPEFEPTEDGETEFPSIRERLEAHRAAPDCAACHNMLDPIGLSLENFDVIGRWRDTYEDGHVIDATAEYQGEPINGLQDLAQRVALEPSFLRCPTEKMLSYALRRTPHGDDLKLAGRVVDAWDAGSIRDLVKLVATSDAFRFRRGANEEGN